MLWLGFGIAVALALFVVALVGTRSSHATEDGVAWAMLCSLAMLVEVAFVARVVYLNTVGS